MTSFILKPTGPFSLSCAADVIANLPPLRHQPRPSSKVRLGFVLDQDHTSVAVSLREVRGVVHGAASDPRRVDAIAKQVARILSLDHDATAYPDLARRDPKLGAVMNAFPAMRPVCFTSPYEAACWAI